MNDSDQIIRRVLDNVGHDLDPSILIGGWATHLRVGGEISHDIDLIVTASLRYLLDAEAQGGGARRVRGRRHLLRRGSS